MKTIFKILVIIVLAVLVGSLFYGVVTAISSGTNQLSISARPVDGEFARPDREGDAGGLQFPADSIKNLAIISIISIIYLNVPKLWKRKKPTLQIAQ